VSGCAEVGRVNVQRCVATIGSCGDTVLSGAHDIFSCDHGQLRAAYRYGQSTVVVRRAV
jgi:hypothetical protein